MRGMIAGQRKERLRHVRHALRRRRLRDCLAAGATIIVAGRDHLPAGMTLRMEGQPALTARHWVQMELHKQSLNQPLGRLTEWNKVLEAHLGPRGLVPPKRASKQ
jgi:hypothetical protein